MSFVVKGGLMLAFIHAWSGQSGRGFVPHSAAAADPAGAAPPPSFAEAFAVAADSVGEGAALSAPRALGTAALALAAVFAVLACSAGGAGGVADAADSWLVAGGVGLVALSHAARALARARTEATT